MIARKATLETVRSEDISRVEGRLALITGASSGVGKAIALALAQRGARICAIGRNAAALDKVVAASQAYSEAFGVQADLTKEDELQGLVEQLAKAGGVKILVHSAGIYRQDPIERAAISDLDLQFLTNARAPYRLTQLLLPQLTAAGGQIVFINSSAGLRATRPEIGQYAATKHALRAIADCLRSELNPKGVRVLSVYLGRTATPMQQAIMRDEGKTWNPHALLQPADIASTVVHALTLPPTAEITDLTIRPMRKL